MANPTWPLTCGHWPPLSNTGHVASPIHQRTWRTGAGVSHWRRVRFGQLLRFAQLNLLQFVG